MKDVFSAIDDLIIAIRSKDNSQSYFPEKNLLKFEFKFSLCLDIIRYELQIDSGISDSTADAFSLLYISYAMQYYNKDFPDIGKKCSILFNKIVPLNARMKSHDLSRKIGFEDADIVRYFKRRISELLIEKTNPQLAYKGK